MTATSTPSRPDPTRTGAVWVTGTGAFLLLAAAAVFVAVRWGDIPDEVKLGVLGLATGGFLLAGRGLRTSLPATSGALFHLGAFLVPINSAALGVHAELDWSTLLLTEGTVATITFGWAAVTERSVVLRSAFAVAAVALAGGIGATTDLPAPLVLAGFAMAALAGRREGLATGWAVLAGVAPVLTFVDHLTISGADAFTALGLTGEQPRLVAVLTGITAAVTLGIVGRRRHDTSLVLLGTAIAGIGVSASWSGQPVEPTNTAVGLAAVFLLIELVAHATRRDEFWSHPSGLVATIAEWLAACATLAAGLVVLFAPVIDEVSRSTALATLILGGGWLVADRRRGSRGLVVAALACATCLASAVATGTANDPLLSATLVAIAAGAVLSGHRTGTTITVLAAVWAPVVAFDHTATQLVVGALGSLVLAEAAVRRAPAASAEHPGAADVSEQWAWIVSATALVPAAIAMSGYIAETGELVTGLVGGAIAATVIAVALDRGSVTGDLPLGTLARVGAVSVLAGAADRPGRDLAVVAGAVAALSIVDALRRSDPIVALGASVAVPVAVGASARALELSVPRSGVALTVAAAVLLGLGSVVGSRWARPFVVGAALATGGGLWLAAPEPSAFADAVMVASGIALAWSIDRGRLDGVLLSGLTMTGGIWLRLADAGVGSSEPYLAPVALLLVGAGLRARSIGTSSWVAYGPAVTVFGGAALAERLTGGPGWHALVAGSVGVVAVACGGYRKLAAPLFLGTALLVALVGYETLAITAALPTWTWLAAGGSALLAAGIAMERRDLSPVETGRRLVDVIDDTFA